MGAAAEGSRAVGIAGSGGASAAVQQEAEEFQQDALGRLERVKKDRILLDAVLDVSVSSEIHGYTTGQVDRILALAQPSPDEQYTAAFRQWGLDVDGTPEADVVARLRQEPDVVVQELIAGLDAWMVERRTRLGSEADWRRLFRLADQLDHGDRSRRLRALLAEATLGRETIAAGLREIHKDIDPRTEPVLAVVLLSRVCAMAGDTAGAEAVLRQVATARPDQVVLLHELAKLLHRRHPQLREAIEYYRAARGLRPNLCIGLSLALRSAGRLTEAEDVLRELALQKPGNLVVYFHLASNLTAQEKYAEAAEANRKIIDLKPDFAEAYNNLGSNLDGQGKYAEAERALRKAIELKPDLEQAHFRSCGQSRVP
jgi:Flp pilus assembly protein TadD